MSHSISDKTSRFLRAFALSLASVVAFVGVAQSQIDISKPERERMTKESWLALDYIQNFHYDQKPLTSLDNAEILTEYMEELDSSKMLFTQEDYEQIMLRFGENLNSVYLRRGDIFPAFAIFEIYSKNALDRMAWVEKRLEEDFDFTTEETYRPDRSELGWPANKEEADDLWRKRLKYELVLEMVGDTPLAEAKDKIKRRYEQTRRYIEEIEAHNVQEVFINTVASLYDPHSTFFSADAIEEFRISMQNSLVGIGALLRDEDGYCVIQELIAGGPAEASGELNPGDKIVAVAEPGEEPTDVVNMKLRKIVKMIRGKQGTEVVLKIQPAKAGVGEVRTVRLIRDEVQLTSQLAKAEILDVPMGDETVPIGVIDLPSFYGEGTGENANAATSDDVEELLGKLKEVGVRGVVLDLRSNGGGLLREAVRVAGLFIEEGPVVQVKDTTGKIRVDRDTNSKIAYVGPLVVLVDKNSASASEIVAGALQDHNRALIVGDSSTHGKGTVQAVFELDRGFVQTLFQKPQKLGATKVTIQKFYLPKGESTQREGVHSDIVIPSINEFLEIGEADLENAMAWDTIDPIEWRRPDEAENFESVITEDVLQTLRRKSMERQLELEEFDYLREYLDWFEEKQEQEEYSLNLEKRREIRDRDNAFNDRLELVREQLSDKNYDSRLVLLTLSQAKEDEHQAKLLSSTLPDGRRKSNVLYERVLYYQPEEDGKVYEVWIENINYRKHLADAEEIASQLSEKTGIEISGADVETLLTKFRTADRTAEMEVDLSFKELFGGRLDAHALGQLKTNFFIELIERQPYLLENKPPIDINLREGARILADWISIIDRKKAANDEGSVTAKIEKEQDQVVDPGAAVAN